MPEGWKESGDHDQTYQCECPFTTYGRVAPPRCSYAGQFAVTGDECFDERLCVHTLGRSINFDQVNGEFTEQEFKDRSYRCCKTTSVAQCKKECPKEPGDVIIENVFDVADDDKVRELVGTCDGACSCATKRALFLFFRLFFLLP